MEKNLVVFGMKIDSNKFWLIYLIIQFHLVQKNSEIIIDIESNKEKMSVKIKDNGRVGEINTEKFLKDFIVIDQKNLVNILV